MQLRVQCSGEEQTIVIAGNINILSTTFHPQAGVPLLFWTCANEVTPMSQAKRFYPLFAILGNLGPIASGQTVAYVSRNRPAGMDSEMAFERTLKVLFC